MTLRPRWHSPETVFSLSPEQQQLMLDAVRKANIAREIGMLAGPLTPEDHAVVDVIFEATKEND